MSGKGIDPYCTTCLRGDRVLYHLGDDVFTCGPCEDVQEERAYLRLSDTSVLAELAEECREVYEQAGDGWYPEDR